MMSGIDFTTFAKGMKVATFSLASKYQTVFPLTSDRVKANFILSPISCILDLCVLNLPRLRSSSCSILFTEPWVLFVPLTCCSALAAESWIERTMCIHCHAAAGIYMLRGLVMNLKHCHY